MLSACSPLPGARCPSPCTCRAVVDAGRGRTGMEMGAEWSPRPSISWFGGLGFSTVQARPKGWTSSLQTVPPSPWA